MRILKSNPFSEELTHEQAINALLSLINHISGKTIEDELPNHDDSGTFIQNIESVYETMSADNGMYKSNYCNKFNNNS